MIKMKKLMEGFSYNRKFGEPLPTLKDFSKKNSNVDNIKEKLWKHENLLKNDKIIFLCQQHSEGLK